MLGNVNDLNTWQPSSIAEHIGELYCVVRYIKNLNILETTYYFFLDRERPSMYKWWGLVSRNKHTMWSVWKWKVGEAQTENVVYHLKVSITFYYLFKRYVNKYNILCDHQAKNHRHCGLLISGTPSVFPVFDRIINKKYIICWPYRDLLFYQHYNNRFK